MISSEEPGQLNRVYCLVSSRSPIMDRRPGSLQLNLVLVYTINLIPQFLTKTYKSLRLIRRYRRLKIRRFWVKLLTIRYHLILPVSFYILLSLEYRPFVGFLHTQSISSDNRHVPIDDEIKPLRTTLTIQPVGSCGSIRFCLDRVVVFEIGSKFA